MIDTRRLVVSRASDTIEAWVLAETRNTLERVAAPYLIHRETYSAGQPGAPGWRPRGQVPPCGGTEDVAAECGGWGVAWNPAAILCQAAA